MLWYDGGEEGVGISAQTRSVAGDKSLRHASRRSLTHSLELGTTRDFDRIFANARGGFEVDSGSARTSNAVSTRLAGAFQVSESLKQKMEVREPARWAR